MAVMPFLCRDPFFHQNIIPQKYKLAPKFANFQFFFLSNKNLYKRSRLYFFQGFSIKIYCHNMFQFLKLHQMIQHKLILHFFVFWNLYKGCSVTILKSLENKNDNNFVNESYLFTQISTIAKTNTITAQEPSIYSYSYLL